MVMELCDLGNLRRALEKGLLHKPLMESRRIVVDMELLLEVRFASCNMPLLLLLLPW